MCKFPPGSRNRVAAEGQLASKFPLNSEPGGSWRFHSQGDAGEEGGSAKIGFQGVAVGIENVEYVKARAE